MVFFHCLHWKRRYVLRIGPTVLKWVFEPRHSSFVNGESIQGNERNNYVVLNRREMYTRFVESGRCTIWQRWANKTCTMFNIWNVHLDGVATLYNLSDLQKRYSLGYFCESECTSAESTLRQMAVTSLRDLVATGSGKPTILINVLEHLFYQDQGYRVYETSIVLFAEERHPSSWDRLRSIYP